MPFARYVLENAGKLQFPFRRYQIQKVWRGERPQEGRYREFLQADIDVVDRDTLPFHYDVEIPLVIGDALRGLPIPPVRIQVNNRKLCEGFYRGLGLADPEAALRAVDKLDKIGPAGVADAARRDGRRDRRAGEGVPGAGRDLAEDASFVDAVRALGVSRPAARRGPRRAGPVVEAAREHAPGLVVADLKIARGPRLLHRHGLRDAMLPATSSSARSAPAAATTTWPPTGDRRYPGVGISIGVSRMLGLLFGAAR